MNTLATKECVPCKAGASPLKGDFITRLSKELGHDWNVVGEHHLEKSYTFKDFRQALDFTNQVGELAEEVQHHPDIFLTWGKVSIKIWTHKIDGLSEGDFILAAKIEQIKR